MTSPPITNVQQERVHHRETINGVYSKDIVVDTGAGKTLVRGDLVTPDDIIDGEVTIQCAHGDAITYPLAAVKIAVSGKEIVVHAAVAKSLPVAALLGWDVPELMKLVKPLAETKPVTDSGGPSTTYSWRGCPRSCYP